MQTLKWKQVIENEWYMEVNYFNIWDSVIFFNMGFNYWKEEKQKVNGKQNRNFKKKQRKRSCS